MTNHFLHVVFTTRRISVYHVRQLSFAFEPLQLNDKISNNPGAETVTLIGFCCYL